MCALFFLALCVMCPLLSCGCSNINNTHSFLFISSVAAWIVKHQTKVVEPALPGLVVAAAKFYSFELVD